MKWWAWTTTFLIVLASVLIVKTDAATRRITEKKLSISPKHTHTIRDRDGEFVLTKAVPPHALTPTTTATTDPSIPSDSSSKHIKKKSAPHKHQVILDVDGELVLTKTYTSSATPTANNPPVTNTSIRSNHPPDPIEKKMGTKQDQMVLEVDGELVLTKELERTYQCITLPIDAYKLLFGANNHTQIMKKQHIIFVDGEMVLSKDFELSRRLRTTLPMDMFRNVFVPKPTPKLAIPRRSSATPRIVPVSPSTSPPPLEAIETATPDTSAKENLYKSIFGKAPAQEAQEDRVTLFVDGEKMGEVVISTHLFSKDFEMSPQWLSPLPLNTEQRESLTQSIDPESKLITTKTLTKNGFKWEYRKGLGQVTLESPVSSKKKVIHRIGDESSKKTKSKAFNPAKISGAFQVEGRHYDDQLNVQSGMQLDVSSFINIDNTVLNAHSVGRINQTIDDAVPAMLWNLDQLNVGKIDRATGLDYSAGTIDSMSSDFLYVPKIWGVRIGSVTDANRFQRIHFGSMSIFLDQMATVTIFVNGVLLDTFYLSSGEHQFTHIPLNDGVSVVEIVATDPKTKQIILCKKDSFLFNSTILDPGKTDYFGQVGVASDVLDSAAINTAKTTAALGFQTGIDDQSMGSAYIRARADTLLFGTGLTQLIPIGLLRSNVGASYANVGIGLAGRIEYTSLPTLLPMNSQVSVLSESYSEKFIGSDTLPQNPFKNRYFGSIAMAPMGIDSLHLKLYVDIQDSVTSNTLALYGGAVDVPLSSTSRLVADTAVDKKNHLALNVIYSIFQTNSWSIDCSFKANDTISYIGFGFGVNLISEVGVRTKFDPNNRAVNVSYKDTDTSLMGSYVENDRPRYRRFMGIDASTTQWGQIFSGSYGLQNDNSGTSTMVALAYSGLRGIANYSNYDLIDKGLRKTVSGASYGTALLFADGVLAISAPVQGSFALVRPAATLGGTPIVANGKVRSDGLGPLVLSKLMDGAENSVFIDAPDAEMSLDLGKQSYALVPNYKNGYLINFGSTGTVIVRGMIYDKSGKPFIQRKLRISAVQTDGDFPDKVVLTSRDGEMIIAGLPTGEYVVFSGASKTPIIRLQLSQSNSELLDLGEIRLHDDIITIKK